MTRSTRPDRALTSDVGRAIADCLIDSGQVVAWSSDGSMSESFEIVHVDDDDPDNLSILLGNGQRFIVQIVAV